MAPTRVFTSAVLLSSVLAGAVWAAPPYHAMELSAQGDLYFVDLPRARLLRLNQQGLVVISDLVGVGDGDHLYNLVSTHTGELYLGDKKSLWRIGENGSVEPSSPPEGMKYLFARRPADLAPDGSIYVARDFRKIERSLPGGSAHPVIVQGSLGRIESMTVTPFGRIYLDNGSELVQIDADGRLTTLRAGEGDTVVGLAAESEDSVLMLRLAAGGVDLLRVDGQGESEVILSADQIAAVTAGEPEPN